MSSFNMRDVAAYLRISHQRISQMYAEGKLPDPDQIDGIGPMWKPATIERWAERHWWEMEESAEKQPVEGGPPQCPQAPPR